MNRTEPQARVLLSRLTVRTSARGNRYMTGWCGANNLIAFRGEDDEAGNEVWDLFLAERRPAPKQQSLPMPPRRPRSCGHVIDLEAVAAE